MLAALALALSFQSSPFGRGAFWYYCDALPNSTGQAASISFGGVPDLNEGDGYPFHLQVCGLPPHQGFTPNYGFWIYGRAETALPFGNGLLCVDPYTAPGLLRIEQEACCAPAGCSVVMSYGNLKRPTPITPGSTWNFQFVYRDPAARGFNLSNAVHVQFAP